jgi:hypothetical protein
VREPCSGEEAGGVPEPLFLTADGTPTPPIFPILRRVSKQVFSFLPTRPESNSCSMPSVEAVFLHLPGCYGSTQIKAHTGPANLDHHPVSPHCLWFTPGFASATLTDGSDAC